MCEFSTEHQSDGRISIDSMLIGHKSNRRICADSMVVAVGER